MSSRWLLWLGLLASACSDYSFKDQSSLEAGSTTDSAAPAPEDEPSPAPLAAVTPGAVDLGILCTTGTDIVTVENQGDADLTVTRIDTNSPSWSASHAPLPAVLGPGDTFAIDLVGSAVSTTMVIETDDPANATLSVPLTGSPDEAPTVEIIDPLSGAVIPIGAETLFRASVADDAGPADGVSIAWTSDVDGLLGTGSADGAGVSSLDWRAADRSGGTHEVTITATDTCGNRATSSITVCQNEGYLAENLDLSTWNFEGTASWDAANGWVQLTVPTTNQSGTAFQTSATVDAANVQIEFSFYASGGSGADGLSVTALDASRMTGFVGSSGGGIGYAGLPGWSIEVDTWDNGRSVDPTADDHVALHIDGSGGYPVQWATLPEMEDGNWHTMSVRVLGTHIWVSIDGVVYLDVDEPSLTSFPAYIGFTGATGAVTNYHLIDALMVEEYVCATEG